MALRILLEETRKKTMFKFFTNLFDDNRKNITAFQKRVDQINELEPEFKKLTDIQLSRKTQEFKKRIAQQQADGVDDTTILDTLLPEAFATVREASRRVLGMRHYDVQLIAGIGLHTGMITEQRTGEGKTLTVTAPLYLNALMGNGAHLITVNDYLAELGAGWMGPVYHFLGLSSAVIVHDHSRLYNPAIDSEERGDERLEHFEEITRRAAYAADITYGTNNEFGFDYLRDNMVQNEEQMAQRFDSPHYYTIVDEADSILIDEARTPLIISAPDTTPVKQYFDYAKMVTILTRDVDYNIDEKARSVTLTDLGVKRVEQKLGVSNLYEESFDTIHHIESALKAKTIFQRDKDYIVREGEVIIVDEHTGRLMYGRRYSDGLHQAIEAKEGVNIQNESRTLATISIQNYFRLYKKLSGMTGTAQTESEEFMKIYGAEVLVVPTNKEVVRVDTSDVVYKTTAAKYTAITNEVIDAHGTGQPVLIGTKSIEHNQIISNFLKRKGIEHQVLNAKNHEKEAFIISDAGKKGAITVATNIAGRGVDIVLGGAAPELKEYRKKTRSTKELSPAERKKLLDSYGLQLPPSVHPLNYKLAEYAKDLESWREQHQAVKDLGGLYVIGTERHESRRIDNQLRGRSGRQGDPGRSQFFVSLEDDVMRIFGGEQIARVMDMLKIDENQPIEHGMVSKSIESAQVKVEGFFFDQRKRLVEFDDVMNKQRAIIYERRRRLLKQSSNEAEEESLHSQILGYITDEVKSIATIHSPEGDDEADYHELVSEFSKLIPFDKASQQSLTQSLKKAESVEESLLAIALDAYESRKKSLGEEHFALLEKLVTLSTIDEKWMDHLDAMDSLREGIWLRGDKKTVLSEYKKEGFVMFENLIQSIQTTIANRLFRVQLRGVQQKVAQSPQKQAVEQKQAPVSDLAAALAGNAPQAQSPQSRKGSVGDLAAALGSAHSSAKPKPGVAGVRIGRNDVCPCGSGKKYKKCGLINAPGHTN